MGASEDVVSDWFGNTRQAVYAAFLRTTFYTLFTPDMRWIRVNN